LPTKHATKLNISPTRSILDFSMDHSAPLLPTGLHESLLLDAEPAKITVGVHMVTYKIIEDTSICGKDKLFDCVGYSYTMKRRSDQSTR